MTTLISDELLGTFAVIEPKRWANIEVELWSLSFGHLWIKYEGLLHDIKELEWHLGCPDEHMLPEDIPENIAKWDELRQMQPLYEDILVQRGWDRITPPAYEELPHCRVCSYRMNHWDEEKNVCEDCREEIRRDMYDEWRWREQRYW
jgi:hypothetical protein